MKTLLLFTFILVVTTVAIGQSVPDFAKGSRLAGYGKENKYYYPNNSPAKYSKFGNVVQLSFHNNSLYYLDNSAHTFGKIDANGTVTTIAGQAGYEATISYRITIPPPSEKTFLKAPKSFAISPDEEIFIVNQNSHWITKIDKYGYATIVSGNGAQSIYICQDGTTFASCNYNFPTSIAFNPATGKMYISDNNNIIYEVYNGLISVFAGYTNAEILQTSIPSGNRLSETALLYKPFGLTFGPDGNLYFLLQSHRLGMINMNSNEISIIAGGISGCKVICLNNPAAIAFGLDGSLYISNTMGNDIKKLNPALTSGAGYIGTGSAGYCGEGAAASTTCAVQTLAGIAVHPTTGDLYFSEVVDFATPYVGRIRTVSNSKIYTYGGSISSTTDTSVNGPAMAASESYFGMAHLPSGELLVATNPAVATNTGIRIRKILSNGLYVNFMGYGSTTNPSNMVTTYGPNTYLKNVQNIYVNNNYLYAVDIGNHCIYKMNLNDYTSSVVAGITGSSGSTDGALGTNKLNSPHAMTFLTNGNMYITQEGGGIRMLTSAGALSTISGDGLTAPRGISSDSSGVVYITDPTLNVIKKYSGGSFSSFAGGGSSESLEMNDPLLAKLNGPFSVEVSSNGDVYFYEKTNFIVRKVSKADGKLYHVAGIKSDSSTIFKGNNIDARSTIVGGSTFGFLHSNGASLYISSYDTKRIRKVDLTSMKVSTVACSDSAFINVDSTDALHASIESNTNLIRKISPSGEVSTVIGTGYAFGNAENATGLESYIGEVRGLWVTQNKDIYFSDFTNNKIRVMNSTTGLITTLASNLGGPSGIYVKNNDIYFVDTATKSIRLLFSNGTIQNLTPGFTLTNPNAITLSSDGEIYFSDTGFIGKLQYPNYTIAVTTSTSPYFTFGYASGLAWVKNRLYFSDTTNSKIGRLYQSTPSVVIGVGSSNLYSDEDGFAPTKLYYSSPSALWSSPTTGEMFIADQGHNLIRKVKYGTCANPKTFGIDTMMCNCPTGFAGTSCQTPICNNIPATSQDVCSGRGTCTQPDVCSCNNNYFGDFCDVTTCADITSNSTSVCLGRGKCIRFNKCTCNEEFYFGDNCEATICYDKLSFAPSVCSGHGLCKDFNNCSCTANFYGPACEFTTCYGIVNSNTSVCSGNGQCNDLDLCSCSPNWWGETCNLTSCYSHNNTDMDVCSKHGKCVDFDVCTCDNGYYGDECNIPMCSGILGNETSVCSGRGECASYNSCNCSNSNGWIGSNCEIPVCFGLNASQTQSCNGNGDCIDIDTCQCDTNWFGLNCSIPSCYSILSNDSTVCSSHGKCLNIDTCECKEGWFGSNCSIPSCFSIISNDSNVCSYHGKCMSLNYCQCDSGWFGSNCSIPSCFEILSNNSNVCSSNGKCSNVDTCECNSGWFGLNCSIPSCYSKLANESTVCTGHGACKSVDSCQCSNSWIGSNCEIPVCFGFNASNPQSCNENGDCIGIDTCQCDTNWFGLNCSIPSCYSTLANDSTVCSSHGKCSTVDTCECKEGWFGTNCSIHSCFGISSINSNVCSSHGKCSHFDTCECNSGWTGPNCSLPICFELISDNPAVCSSNGKCLNVDTCKCNSGWFGTNCSLPSCFHILANNSLVCSGNGQCTSLDTCECKEGWFASDCLLPSCFGLGGDNPTICSGNGLCVFKDVCECNPGWFDIDCSLPSCFDMLKNDSAVCSSHGKCNSLDTCECNQGWSGKNCSLPSCFGKSNEDTSVCSSHGKCLNVDTCQCDTNWFGPSCSISSCFGILSNDSNVCSSNGKCSQPDSCKCNSGWFGTNCSLPSCFNVLANNSNACSSHGQCRSLDTCECKEGWFGTNCSIPSCFSIISSDANVCSSYGKCTDLNTCECNSGWFGSNCSIPSCFGIVSNDSTVCSSNGKCSTLNTCECKEGWFGLNCSTPSCFGLQNDNPLICSSHGKCVSLNECSCDNGYYSSNCSEFDCFGINRLNHSVCSSNGKCSDLNNCTCNIGYYGSNCENQTIPIISKVSCFGEYFDSPTVCSGNGLCISENTCQCNSTYYGNKCQYIQNPSVKCFGISATNSSACYGNGICVSENVCECNFGFKGSQCSSCIDNYYGNECKTIFYGPAILGSLGNTLEFKLFTTPSYTSNVVNCKKFISEISLFGSNPSCYWSDKLNGNFIIEFGGDSTITPNRNISLNVNIFDSNLILFKEINLIPSPNPIKPISKVIYKSVYSSCEEIILDATGSYSGDLKTLKYYWNIESLPFNNLNNVNDLIIFKNGLQSIVNLNTSISGLYQLSLIVESSFTNAKSEKLLINLEISQIPQPIISILNSKDTLQNIQLNSLPIIIKKGIELPSCYYSNQEMTFKWNQLSGSSVEYYIDQLNNLVITKFNSSSLNDYTFSVTAISKYNSYSNSTTSVTITTISQSLQLNIFTTQLTTLKASVQIDYNDPDSIENELEIYYWNCISGCGSNIVNNLNQYSLSKLSLFDLEKSISNTMKLELTISKGIRNVKKELIINFPESVSQIPPIISLISILPNRYKLVKEETLSLQLSIILDGADSNNLNIDQYLIREWTLNGELISNNAQLTSLMALPPSQSNGLIISLSYLNEETVYNLNLKATDSRNSLSASYSYQFKVVKSPKSCLCTVSPSRGYAFETSFTFSCPNCQNIEQSIDFKFGFIDDKSKARIPLYSLGERFATYFPMPSSGSTLSSYISIVDTATTASVELINNVIIDLPVAKTMTDVKKKVKAWQTYASGLSATDPAKLVFNSATITRTSELMNAKLGARSISETINCNQGVWNVTTQKCDCFSGYKSATCNLKESDYLDLIEIRTNLIESMVLSMDNRNPQENLPSNHFSVYMYGLDGISSKTISTFDLPFQSLSQLSKKVFNKAVLNTKMQIVNGIEILMNSLFDNMGRMIMYDKLEQSYGPELMNLFKDFNQIMKRNQLPGQKEMNINNIVGNCTTAVLFRNQAINKTINAHNDGVTFYNLDSKLSNRISLFATVFSFTDILGLKYQIDASNTITNENSKYNVTTHTIKSNIISNIVMVEKSFNSNVIFNFNSLSPTRSEIIVTKIGQIQETKTIESTLICLPILANNTILVDVNSGCKIERIGQVHTCACSNSSINSVVILENIHEQINRLTIQDTPTPLITTSGTIISNNRDLLWLLALVMIVPIVACIIGVLMFVIRNSLKKNNSEQTPDQLELKVTV